MNGTPRAYRGSPSARMPRPMKIARLMSPPPNARRTAPLPIVGLLSCKATPRTMTRRRKGGEHERERDLPRERHLPRPCRLSPAERVVDVWPAPEAAHVTAGAAHAEPHDRPHREKDPWLDGELRDVPQQDGRRSPCGVRAR